IRIVWLCVDGVAHRAAGHAQRSDTYVLHLEHACAGFGEAASGATESAGHREHGSWGRDGDDRVVVEVHRHGDGMTAVHHVDGCAADKFLKRDLPRAAQGVAVGTVEL